MLSTWQQPSWVKFKTYDKTSGKLVSSDKTVFKAKIEGGPSKLQIQQHHVAEKFSLDKWDTCLRNMGSPQHGDHPLVWAHYL
jgi:capsule polysaccharide modification protein KpsS